MYLFICYVPTIYEEKKVPVIDIKYEMCGVYTKHTQTYSSVTAKTLNIFINK